MKENAKNCLLKIAKEFREDSNEEIFNSLIFNLVNDDAVLNASQERLTKSMIFREIEIAESQNNGRLVVDNIWGVVRSIATYINSCK